MFCQVLRMRVGTGVVWELTLIPSPPVMQVEPAPGTFIASVAENLLKKQKAVGWWQNKPQRQLVRLTGNERRNVGIFNMSIGWEEQYELLQSKAKCGLWVFLFWCFVWFFLFIFPFQVSTCLFILMERGLGSNHNRCESSK